ncbi:MAG: hypothetical protein QM674_15065 [Burkholderiaceae bacterium]
MLADASTGVGERKTLRLAGLLYIRDTDRALQFLIQTQPVSVTYLTRWWGRAGPA